MKIEETLCREAIELLGEIGFGCENSQVIDLFTATGAAYLDNGRVLLEKSLVEDCIASTPTRQQFIDRFQVPEKSYGGGGTAPLVLEDGKIRQPNWHDVARIMSLAQRHKIPFMFRGVGPRHDAHQDEYQVELMRHHYSGCIYVYVQSLQGVNAALRDYSSGGKIITSHSQFNSPMKFNDAGRNRAIHDVCADMGLPIFLTVMPISYITGPASVYGLALQAVAECLCGLVHTQIIRPGTFVVPAAFPLKSDPRMNYNISFGSIDHQAVNILCAKAFKYTCLPSNQDGCSAGHYPGDETETDVQRAMAIWWGQDDWHQCRHVFGFSEGQVVFSHDQMRRDIDLLENVKANNWTYPLPPWEYDPEAKTAIWEVCINGLNNYKDHWHTLENSRPVK